MTIDQKPSAGKYHTVWDGDALTFRLDVFKCGKLILRTRSDPSDPRGKLVPVGLALESLADRFDESA